MDARAMRGIVIRNVCCDRLNYLLSSKNVEYSNQSGKPNQLQKALPMDTFP